MVARATGPVILRDIMRRHARARRRSASTTLVTPFLAAIVLGGVGLSPSPSAAADTGAKQADETASTDEGTDWGPIIGSCLGVMFGGVIAVWQIRGMKKRDE